MKHHTTLSTAAILAASALLLTSCSSIDNASATSNGETGLLRVVATTSQLTDFATEIGGENIELTGLLPVGGSAHHFDPSPADLLALARADVLIINGAGLEEFVDGAVQASGFKGVVIDTSTGIDLDLAREITLEAETGASGHDHADHSEADHDDAEHGSADHDHDADDHSGDNNGGHSDADGHNHGDLNPHLWTSVRFAEGMASVIAEELARIDPEHAAQYMERAHTYTVKLSALDDWTRAQFERVPPRERLLVSGHDSLRYFLHDYDIEFVGSILQSFEDNAEPSVAEIETLVAKIQERGVRAIFVESSMNPALAQTIAREAKITVVDSAALYADTLGAQGSGASTYIDATVHNVETILSAWGYAADPLPGVLK